MRIGNYNMGSTHLRFWATVPCGRSLCLKQSFMNFRCTAL